MLTFLPTDSAGEPHFYERLEARAHKAEDQALFKGSDCAPVTECLAYQR